MKLKRLAFCLLIVWIACASVPMFVGCNGTPNDGFEGRPVDKTKTQLYVSNYDGGFGDDWLWKASERFEKLHENDVLESGKKGVQVRPVNAKKNGDQILSEMITSTSDVFFCENMPYRDAVLQGYLLDITEAVTTPLTEYGETKSIEDKLTEQQKSWFKMKTGGDTAEKYYAMPHYEGYYGMFYDVDTFDERQLFLSDNGSFTNYAGRGKGADGKADTYDDGLPVNMTQFFKLLDEMKRQRMSPVGWPGLYLLYTSYLMEAYHMAYEGTEQAMLNYIFDGTATSLITVASNGTVTKDDPTTITTNNGYELQRQAGNYYALEFLERLIDGGYWYAGSFNQSQSQLDSQDDFLFGAFEPSQTEIGILIDGTWWENEASATFEAMAKRYPGSAKGERRFGIMPFPMPDGEEARGEQTVLLDHMASTGFVNAKVPEYKKQLAIDFLRFCATDESLVEFTKVTSTPKAYTYDLSDQEMESVTYLGRQVMELKKSANVIYKFSSTPLYYNNQSFFTAHTSKWNIGSQNIPANGLREGTSAEEYFGKLYTTRKTAWGTLK